MSLEAKALKLAFTMGKMANAGLPDKVKSCVQSRSIAGAVIMAIPLWGIEGFLYAFVLWGMYSELCSLAKVPFWKNFFTSILGGFIVNMLVVTVLCFILDFIPVAGWIGSALVGYFSTLLSGCAYLEVLAALHQKGKVKERFDTSKAISSLNNNKRLE